MNITIKGIMAIKKMLDKAGIKSKNDRRKIVTNISRKIRKDNIDRVSQQKNLSGTAFKKHARGRKRKMLVRLARKTKVIAVTESESKIGWRNKFEEGLASRHHYGSVKRMSRDLLIKEKSSKANKGKLDNATRIQARALIQEGFQVAKKNGRGFSTPTIKWITTNMNQGSAGSTLRALKGGGKSTWNIRTPSRDILGITQTQLIQIGDLFTKEVKKL